MLSRIADAHFWMNRYIERTDSIVRMLEINFLWSLERVQADEFSWNSVLKLFSYLKPEEIEELQNDTTEVLKLMITDPKNMNSIASLVTAARENARSIQDQIPPQLWESVNQYYHFVTTINLEDKEEPEIMELFTQIINRCQLFIGTAELNMHRGEGWVFMNLGKYIGRAIQTAYTIDVKFTDFNYDLENPFDIPYWRHFLKSVSAYQLYIQSYSGGIETHNVLDLMILNPSFPRSLMYCLKRTQYTFDRLRDYSIKSDYETIAFRIGKLAAKVKYTSVTDISDAGLDQYLKSIIEELVEISNLISERYFSYQ